MARRRTRRSEPVADDEHGSNSVRESELNGTDNPRENGHVVSQEAGDVAAVVELDDAPSPAAPFLLGKTLDPSLAERPEVDKAAIKEKVGAMVSSFEEQMVRDGLCVLSTNAQRRKLPTFNLARVTGKSILQDARVISTLSTGRNALPPLQKAVIEAFLRGASAAAVMLHQSASVAVELRERLGQLWHGHVADTTSGNEEQRHSAPLKRKVHGVLVELVKLCESAASAFDQCMVSIVLSYTAGHLGYDMAIFADKVRGADADDDGVRFSSCVAEWWHVLT